ncbi:hypothetical protein TNCV_998621 [Trichonephila clavipes]|nr:hypothetical protein TNCV_998621 [Trichonephila clavipes]
MNIRPKVPFHVINILQFQATCDSEISLHCTFLLTNTSRGVTYLTLYQKVNHPSTIRFNGRQLEIESRSVVLEEDPDPFRLTSFLRHPPLQRRQKSFGAHPHFLIDVVADEGIRKKQKEEGREEKL